MSPACVRPWVRVVPWTRTSLRNGGYREELWGPRRRRTRKVCRAQQRAITRRRRCSSTTGSGLARHGSAARCSCHVRIRNRRWCKAWVASCCSRVRAWPRGVLVDMRVSIWGSMHATKPRSCQHRLPADQADGVVSAMWCHGRGHHRRREVPMACEGSARLLRPGSIAQLVMAHPASTLV